MSEDAPAPGPKLATLKIVGIAIFVVWLPLDLWSKSYMQDLLGLVSQEGQSQHQIDVIPGFLAWQGTWNPGATFGFFSGHTILILTLTSLATVGLAIWFTATKARSRCLHVGLALILSGAIGNLRDRWQWGEVRDFILIYIGDLSDPDVVKIFGLQVLPWPNFNVADAGIVVGVSLVLWDALFGYGAKEAKRKALEKAAARSKTAAAS